MSSLVGRPTPELGRLETVALREVWEHEALAFTPWMLANADALSDALDMDLELDAAEHAVGGFSLDLIGTDRASNELVIIENQLETTDHSHLGQLLTYAGGTDPTNVVWVAATFREEHRAALEWLNQRTDTATRFFGVEVAAVRIDESRPAPLFRVVVKPNDWGKNVRTRAQAAEGGASERNMAYAAFWEQYLTAMSAAGFAWTRTRRGPAQNWLPTPSGTSGVEFTVSFSRQGLRSELYLGDRSDEVNAERFAAFAAEREVLEQTYGAQLAFEPLEGRKACRIADHRDGDISDEGSWPQYIEWFIDSQRRLRQAVNSVRGIPTPASPTMQP